MTHRHHYNYGEPTVTVILVAALALVLALCRYWCREAKKERNVFRRQIGRRRSSRGRRLRGDVITHHLILRVPPSIDIDGQSLQAVEFTASAPRYSLVMQNPSLFLHTLPRAPETPPPPYRDSSPPYTLVDTLEMLDDVKVQHV